MGAKIESVKIRLESAVTPEIMEEELLIELMRLLDCGRFRQAIALIEQGRAAALSLGLTEAAAALSEAGRELKMLTETIMFREKEN